MKKDTVLILTAKDEVSIPKVEYFLNKMGQRFSRIDIDTFLENSGMITMAVEKGKLNCRFTLFDYNLSLDSVKSIWFRRPKSVSTKFLKCDERTSHFIEKEFSTAFLSLYTSLPEIYWMNHPIQSRNIFDRNKLLQLKIAALSGLSIPYTIITNNHDELLEFCLKHGGFIAVKPLHTSIFQDVDNNATAIYTNKVSYEYLKSRSANIILAPLIAQEYVEKDFELRVTVVGKQILTCAIHSQESERTKIDWRRYDFDNVKHEPYELPLDIQTKIQSFMQSCGLTFGAIDMIVTLNGEYVFLEINPAGQFGWIEEQLNCLYQNQLLKL